MLKTRLAGRLSLSRAEFRTKSDPRLAQIKKKLISHCCNSSFVCGCGYFVASCSARLYAAATRADAECAVFGVGCRTVGLSAMFSADMISFCLYVLRDPSKRFRMLVPLQAAHFLSLYFTLQQWATM